MSKAPTLKAGPLRIVSFASRHFTDAYIAWLNDPAIMRYSQHRHKKHDRESCAAYIDSFASGPDLLWAIKISNSNEHIGNISATFDTDNRLADMGILIGVRSMQGKGYGKHAWQAVLDYLTGHEDIFKVTGGCLERNRAMVHIMKNCGMIQDGYRNELFLVDDLPVSLVFFSKRGKWHVGGAEAGG